MPGVLHRLQVTPAGDLAVRWNCKAGKCGSRSTEINGRPRLAYMTRLTITPMRTFPVTRGLVTGMLVNCAKARQIPSVTPDPSVGLGEFRMRQADVETHPAGVPRTHQDHRQRPDPAEGARRRP